MTTIMMTAECVERERHLGNLTGRDVLALTFRLVDVHKIHRECVNNTALISAASPTWIIFL